MKTPTLWSRALALLLLVQQLLGPLTPSLGRHAHADEPQNSSIATDPNALEGHLRLVNFGTGLHDMEELMKFLDASPSAELAKDLVLRGTIKLARQFHATHAPAPMPTSPGRADHDILYSFLQRRQNPIVNALALAENVVALARPTPENAPALKEYVFQNTFRIETSQNTLRGMSQGIILPFNWGEGSDHDVQHATPGSLIEDTRGMQATVARRSGRQYDRGFAQKLVLENEKLFLRSYWMYRGLYQSQIPRDDDEVIRTVINRYLPSDEYRQLKQVAQQTRAMLDQMMPGNYEQTRQSNVTALIERLTQKREQLSAMKNAELSISMMRMYINDALDVANNGGLSMGAQYRAPNLFLAEDDISRELGILSGRTRQTHCLPGGQVELSASGRAAMARVMERMVRDGGTLAQEMSALTEYLRTQRPSRVAGDARGDGCGYDRGTFLRNFLMGRLRAAFGATEYDTLKQQNDAIRDQLIASDPLLFTDTLTINASDMRYVVVDPYELFRIRPETIEYALREQQEAIADGVAEMKEFYESASSPKTMARLIKRTPHLGWQLAAANWRYLGSLGRAYQAMQQVEREDQVRRQVYLWAGVTLGVLAIASGVGGAFVAGTAGSWLTIGSTAIGLFASGMSLYGELSFAAQDYRDYQMLRQQILAGISSRDGNRRREAEELLSSFHWHLGWAAFSGFFTVTEALRLVRSVRTLVQVREALARIPRSAVTGAAQGTDEELAAIIGRRQLGANSQAREVESWVERNAGLTDQQWLDDMMSRAGTATAPTTEEVLAFCLRRADEVVQREFQQAFQNGATFQLRLRERIAQQLRVSGAESGVEIPGWFSRMLRSFKVVGRNLSPSADSILSRPRIESLDDVNEFFRMATSTAARGAHPGQSTYALIRESLYQTLTEREWRGPLKIFTEEVTQNFNTQEALTEAFLSNPNLPAPPAELYRAVYGGNFWRDIARLLGRGEDVVRIRVLAQQFKLIAYGGFLGYMDYAFADDAYGLFSAGYNDALNAAGPMGALIPASELASINARKKEECELRIAFLEYLAVADQSTLESLENGNYPSSLSRERVEELMSQLRSRIARENNEAQLLRTQLSRM